MSCNPESSSYRSVIGAANSTLGQGVTRVTAVTNYVVKLVCR
jgi:hypothetical protein